MSNDITLCYALFVTWKLYNYTFKIVKSHEV